MKVTTLSRFEVPRDTGPADHPAADAAPRKGRAVLCRHARPPEKVAQSVTTIHSQSSTAETARETPPSARTVPKPALSPPSAAPVQRWRRTLRERFRLHTDEHEAPADSRLLVMSFWAAVCVFIGLIPAGRLLVALALGTGPWWYPLVCVALGVLGVGLITGGFAAIHQPRLPWQLLGVATALLAVNVALVYAVF